MKSNSKIIKLIKTLFFSFSCIVFGIAKPTSAVLARLQSVAKKARAMVIRAEDGPVARLKPLIMPQIKPMEFELPTVKVSPMPEVTVEKPIVVAAKAPGSVPENPSTMLVESTFQIHTTPKQQAAAHKDVLRAKIARQNTVVIPAQKPEDIINIVVQEPPVALMEPKASVSNYGQIMALKTQLKLASDGRFIAENLQQRIDAVLAKAATVAFDASLSELKVELEYCLEALKTAQGQK